MKAISLWEPWATLMAVGAKRNETRSWATGHRGNLVICSTKYVAPLSEECRNALDSFHDKINASGRMYSEMISPGMALCVVDMIDCYPSELFHGPTPLKLSQLEASLGDYTLGRFVWMTQNCLRFKTPFPVKGKQGFFNISDELVQQALNL